MPKLTERRHRQTRAEIAQAAIDLFTERGFDAVTMDDVAEVAGTSRRTVYRHFPTKEDLVFEAPRAWFELFDEIIADEHGPGMERCRSGLRAVAARIDETAEAVHTGYQVYLGTPSLRGIRGRLDDESFGRFFALADADLPDNADKVVVAALVAGTLVGALNGAIAAWVMQWPAWSMTELLERALTTIGPVLDTRGTQAATALPLAERSQHRRQKPSTL